MKRVPPLMITSKFGGSLREHWQKNYQKETVTNMSVHHADSKNRLAS